MYLLLCLAGLFSSRIRSVRSQVILQERSLGVAKDGPYYVGIVMKTSLWSLLQSAGVDMLQVVAQ